ncbi:hypothetical protein EXS73_00240 [Candidatus Pacearchaeota archaeon]|nr:hypothetical protein [Candidatus Pacearchaeota archaeon]
MITLRSELRELGFLPSARLYTASADALKIIYAGFAPLRESPQKTDQNYFQDARKSLGYLAQTLDLPEETAFAVQQPPVTNWEFLQTLTHCWGDLNWEPANAPEHYRLRVGRERGLLEDRGIRALWRIGAIQTGLFRDQTHFSVYGLELGRMRETMAESLAVSGKLKGR